MKIFKTALILGLSLILLSCKSKSAGKNLTVGGNSTFKYSQFASGGTQTVLDATILFESSNSTFTKYQVAYKFKGKWKYKTAKKAKLVLKKLKSSPMLCV